MSDHKSVKMTDEDFCKGAVEIVKIARDEGVALGILGAMAVYIHASHSPEFLEKYVAFERLGPGRPMFTDLDVMAYSAQRKKLSEIFEKKLDFLSDHYVNRLFAGRRNIFHHKDGLFDVDVFFDSLSFSHDVRFWDGPGGNRLELDFPTITLADIVLEKLQIHEINRKDLVDLFMLFWTHETSQGHVSEKIDLKHIATVLSDDWGFEYDAKSNIEKLKALLEGFLRDGKVTKEQGDAVNAKIDTLVRTVDGEPKTKAWRKRAKKGTSKPWFNQVEEVER